jgi:hypothetical protein
MNIYEGETKRAMKIPATKTAIRNTDAPAFCERNWLTILSANLDHPPSKNWLRMAL